MTQLCDLHIHSCLSPCGEEEMTPGNVCALARLCGFAMIAVADHGSCGNCRAFVQAGARQGLTVVPAMELNCREEVHVLCYFPDVDTAERFSGDVYPRIPFFRNRPGVFGPQRYVSADDEIVGEEEKLLITAADVSVFEIAALCRSYGGAAVPAHIDRGSNALLSTLGFVDPSMGFSVFEITQRCDERALLETHPELRGARFIRSSDAHCLENLVSPGQKIDLDSATARALVTWLGG